MGIALGTAVLLLAVAAGMQRLWTWSWAPRQAPVPVGSTPAGRASIPPAFDGTKGWAVQGTGDPQFMYPVVAPRAGVVVFRAYGETSYLVARDEKTGTLRWATQPVSTPAPNSTEPSPLLTEKDGKGYAVMGISDTKAKLTYLYVYDTAAAGDQVAPVREITIAGGPVSYSAYVGGLVVLNGDQTTDVVDVTTGQRTTYPDQSAALRPPQACEGCEDHDRVIGVTPRGPLVEGSRAFWVPGGWLGGDPAGGAGTAVTALPTGQVLAASAAPDPGAAEAVWALHDGRTGDIQATVTCQRPKLADGTIRYSAVSSDNRYLLAGSVAFDLQAHQGICIQPSTSYKQIGLTMVDTTGTAYGTADGTHVSVSLHTGQVTPLPDALLPDYVGGNVAILGTTTANGGEIQVYQRR